MAQNAQMVLNWTPSPDATSQRVQRSLNSNGPWTTIATLGATVSTFTDVTVDPTPFTTYYYRIKTICSSGSADTLPVDDVCQNCPTENNAFIFGAKNLDNDTIEVEFTAKTNKWINNNYTPSPLLPTIKTMQVHDIASGNDNRVLFCAECGEDIDLAWQPGEFGTAPGIPSNSSWSYMENQGHIASYLPTPPSGLGGNANFNLGNATRKLSFVNTTAAEAGRFKLGIGNQLSSTFIPWTGGYIAGNTNVAVGQANPSNIEWNFGEMPSNTSTANGPFTSIRIDKRRFVFNPVGTTGNQKLALEAMTGNNVYLSIVEEFSIGSGTNGQTAYYNGALRCEHYLYKLTRKPSFDATDSVGFSMTGFVYVNTGNYQIYGGAFYHQNKFVPYTFNQQPNVYLKIFTI